MNEDFRDAGIVVKDVEDIRDIADRVKSGKIPEKFPDDCYNFKLAREKWKRHEIQRRFHLHWEAKEICNKSGMWAIVDLYWTKQLADWIGNRTVLEVMAGKGWLSAALKRHGVDIIATDDKSWDEEHDECKLQTEVLEVDAISAVQRFSDRDILIVSWSPHDDEIINLVCDGWKKPIIYIGEVGGCNAPDSFFDRFIEDESISINLPKWEGLHDRLMIGAYQSNAVKRS